MRNTRNSNMATNKIKIFIADEVSDSGLEPLRASGPTEDVAALRTDLIAFDALIAALLCH